MSKPLNQRIIRLIILVIGLGVAGSWCIHEAQAQRTTRQQSRVRSSPTSADGLMSLGDYYYRNNDISDAADRYYKKIVDSFPGTKQAGQAQYNRGSYWQRKYYILRETRAANDRTAQAALVDAEGQYYDFVDKFAKQTHTTNLLADAEFNLALVYLQKNNSKTAIGWLNRMLAGATDEDPQVYINRVVWSSNPGDVVDRTVNSAELARFTRDAIASGLTFDQLVSQVKQWCRKQ